MKELTRLDGVGRPWEYDISFLAFPVGLVIQMAHVVSPLDQPSNYKDSHAKVDRQRQNDMLSKSTTLYVGTPSL
jgi:hypothetical protein